jgi:predicted  nucleic acid-binding Zn-ribbon protein
LHSGGDSFLEWKKRMEAREDELKAARSTIAALEARNLELEGASARYKEELSSALERQEVLEAKSSEYDQLRSAVDAGQARIDTLTSDVLRLDRTNAGLEELAADLRVRLAKAVQAESELVDRSSRLQRSVDEQRGTIAGFEAEVSNLSRNLHSVEVERDSARRGLGDAEKRLASLQDEVVALKKENRDLSFEKQAATNSATRFMQSYKEANGLVKRYKHQLDIVHVVRNRTWIHGYEWGIETMRGMSMSDRHKHRVPTVKIEEIFPDPRALDELKEIGVVELPDARFMSTIPRPAAARPRMIEAGGSSAPKVAAESGSKAEPSTGGGAPST